jgi:hypothetical protein
MPDAVIPLRQGHPGFRTVGVEQAEQHLLGDLRGDREIGP